MRASPERPGGDVGGPDAALGEPDGDAADLLDRPADEVRRGPLPVIFGGGASFARRRIAASMAKASITSETWRCQPCQERVSLWSSPSSVLAVSQPSSIAQRRPSTLTSVSAGVPAGHQVVKKASSPSVRLR